MVTKLGMAGVLVLLLPGIVCAQLARDEEMALLTIAVRDAAGPSPVAIARTWGPPPGCPQQDTPLPCTVEATTRIGIRPPSPAQQAGFTNALARARQHTESDSLLPVDVWRALVHSDDMPSRAESARTRCRVVIVSRVAVDATSRFAVIGTELRVGGSAQPSCNGDGYTQSQALLFERHADGVWTRVGTLAGVHADKFVTPRRR